MILSLYREDGLNGRTRYERFAVRPGSAHIWLDAPRATGERLDLGSGVVAYRFRKGRPAVEPETYTLLISPTPYDVQRRRPLP